MGYSPSWTAADTELCCSILRNHTSLAAALAEIETALLRSVHPSTLRRNFAKHELSPPTEYLKRGGWKEETTAPLEPATAQAIPGRVRDFCTSLQREAVDAINAHNGDREKASKSLGITKQAIDDRIKAAWKRAARAGYSPTHDYINPQPEGFHVKGVSTLYRQDGSVAVQWVKSKKDDEDRLDMMREAIASMAEPYKGQSDPALIRKPMPRIPLRDDLLAIYPQGDPHIGMLSWALETGADFDLEIAERHMVAAVDSLVSLAPASRVGWLLDVGDLFHTDNGSNRTNASGHTLDVDSRYAKMIKVGVRTQRRCVERMLEKHEEVWLTTVKGNHDDYSSLWLAIALAEFYANNPRVKVDTSPSTFQYKRFGDCLIGTTHGHNVKPAALPEIMACDRAKDWGETSFRHWYTGHVHHDSVKEFRGCTFETLRTLAARDAWHDGQGYRSQRDMKCDVWHAERGRILRHTVGIEEIERLVA